MVPGLRRVSSSRGITDCSGMVGGTGAAEGAPGGSGGLVDSSRTGAGCTRLKPFSQSSRWGPVELRPERAGGYSSPISRL